MAYPAGFRWGHPLPQHDLSEEPDRLHGTAKIRRKAKRLGWTEVVCKICAALTYERHNGKLIAHYPAATSGIRSKFCRGGQGIKR